MCAVEPRASVGEIVALQMNPVAMIVTMNNNNLTLSLIQSIPSELVLEIITGSHDDLDGTVDRRMAPDSSPIHTHNIICLSIRVH